MPSRPPSRPMTRLSVRNCRRRRRRPAPKAARTATSRCRTVARASRRFATFEQAIRSTQITAPSIIRTTSRSLGPANSSRSSFTSPLQPAWVSGDWAASRPTKAFISARPRSTPTPGFRRPSTARLRSERGLSWTKGSSGVQASWLSGNLKPGGITPAIVWAAALTRITLPTTAGSPLKRRIQSSWLSSTAPGAPARSSSARKGRPRKGLTPRNGNRFHEIEAPSTRSGSPSPEKVRLRLV